VEIDAVTRHLESKGLLTPRLIPSRGGQLWIEHDGVWRLQTRIRGVTHEALESEHAAREAGALLGRFHAALGDLDRDPAGARLGVHDLPRHLATLEEALAKHRTHRDLSQVSTLAEDIAALAAGLPPLPDARRRLVHGDPKISNVLFDPGTGEALCLIDLDTLARRAVTLELGDALRSWCNTRAEDDPGSAFSVSRFAAAIAGYAEAAPNLLAAGEWRVIPDATRRIALVLATRFCTDALNERYFAWDAGRFESASAHNQARTRAQLALAHSLTGARAAMLEIVERAAGP
jgi:Ser/Thr protein kinase RdoA (MazF antagonist)